MPVSSSLLTPSPAHVHRLHYSGQCWWEPLAYGVWAGFSGSARIPAVGWKGRGQIEWLLKTGNTSVWGTSDFWAHFEGEKLASQYLIQHSHKAAPEYYLCLSFWEESGLLLLLGRRAMVGLLPLGITTVYVIIVWPKVWVADMSGRCGWQGVLSYIHVTGMYVCIYYLFLFLFLFLL